VGYGVLMIYKKKCSYCKSRYSESEKSQCNFCLEKRRFRYKNDSSYQLKQKLYSHRRRDKLRKERKELCVTCQVRIKSPNRFLCSRCLMARKHKREENLEVNRQKERESYSKNKTKLRLNRRISSLKCKTGLDKGYIESYLNSREDVTVCDICENPCLSGKSLAIDHCHESNKIRGLLCMNCNQGLGKFKDSPKLLQKAIEYLIGDL